MKNSIFANHSHSTNIIWKSPFQKISQLYSLKKKKKKKAHMIVQEQAHSGKK